MLQGSLKQSAEKPVHDDTGASEAQQGDAGAQQEDEFGREQASRFRDLAQKVEEFVEGKGDLEGALFEEYVRSGLIVDRDSCFPHSEKLLGEGDSDDGSSQHSDDETPMDVDDNPAMQISERRAAMEKLVPGIDPSEYGKMPPSYYSSSQRIAKTTIETETREDAPSVGASSSASISTRTRPIRPPILPRDEYEGADSDDETDEEGEGDEESEEEKPQVEGEIEIDMEQEQEEFLEFARQALGISEDQWRDIVKERQNQGGEF